MLETAHPCKASFAIWSMPRRHTPWGKPECSNLFGCCVVVPPLHHMVQGISPSIPPPGLPQQAPVYRCIGFMGLQWMGCAQLAPVTLASTPLLVIHYPQGTHPSGISRIDLVMLYSAHNRTTTFLSRYLHASPLLHR